MTQEDRQRLDALLVILEDIKRDVAGIQKRIEGVEKEFVKVKGESMADETTNDVAENDKSAHGWKTYLAAGVSLVTGIYDLAVLHDYQNGLKYVVAGLALIGVRGAFAKAISAIRVMSGQ